MRKGKKRGNEIEIDGWKTAPILTSKSRRLWQWYSSRSKEKDDTISALMQTKADYSLGMVKFTGIPPNSL